MAEPQHLGTRQAIPLANTLSGSDVDGDELVYQVVVFPEHGTLIGTAPNLLYTHAPGYISLDSFTFIVNDGELDSVDAVVWITINYSFYAPVIFR